MRLHRSRRRWHDLVVPPDVDQAAQASTAGMLAADMQREVATLAEDHGGQLPTWLRYATSEEE